MSVKVNDYSYAIVCGHAVAAVALSNHQDNIYFVRDLRAALMGISREKVSRQSRGPFSLQSAAIATTDATKTLYTVQSLSA